MTGTHKMPVIKLYTGILPFPTDSALSQIHWLTCMKFTRIIFHYFMHLFILHIFYLSIQIFLSIHPPNDHSLTLVFPQSGAQSFDHLTAFSVQLFSLHLPFSTHLPFSLLLSFFVCVFPLSHLLSFQMSALSVMLFVSVLVFLVTIFLLSTSRFFPSLPINRHPVGWRC